LETAVAKLFQAGLADPRGCEYREVEVVAGRDYRLSGITVKTHGWVLPVSDVTPTNFVIGWNGLLYRAVGVGSPVSMETDAWAMVRAMSPPSLPQRFLFDVGVQSFADEEYCLAVRWLTPVKAAMIFRIAGPDLAKASAELFPTNDPFLALVTDRLWTEFDRALCAHVRGDDELAYQSAQTLTQARSTCEAEAKSRGFSTSQLPDARYLPKPPDTFFPFLETLPALLRDQERRHQRTLPLRNPAGIADKRERVAALIDQLENVSPRQVGEHLDFNLAENPTVQELVNESWDAVEPLLQSYEHDTRLTRMVPMNFQWGGPRSQRTILSVREPAYAALEGIVETPQFAPALSGKETADERAAIYHRSAEAMRAYARRYRGLSRAERLFDILQDASGAWLEAASMLVQPASQPIRPFMGWHATPWVLPLNPDDTAPLRGEALRAKTSPSVSELLIRRIQETAARTSQIGDDAAPLNDACDLALCLAQWERNAALKELQFLSDRAYQLLAPTNYRSYCSHMDLAGQVSRVATLRAKSSDTNALAEHARWVKSIHPEKFFLQPAQILNPLREFPEDPAWKELWGFLFEEEQSPWFGYVRKSSLPDPTRMSTPYFSVETWFATPVINNSSFRKFILSLLREKSRCGTLAGGSETYWLRQDLSTLRRYGYQFAVPANSPNLNGKEFRTCDFYAWLLADRIQGAPAFELYWPVQKRDGAIKDLERLLQPGSGPLKTQPFQEP